MGRGWQGKCGFSLPKLNPTACVIQAGLDGSKWEPNALSLDVTRQACHGPSGHVVRGHHLRLPHQQTPGCRMEVREVLSLESLHCARWCPWVTGDWEATWKVIHAASWLSRRQGGPEVSRLGTQPAERDPRQPCGSGHVRGPL